MSRKRSKYRPKPVRTDTMAFVKSGMKKFNDISVAVDLRISNHHALEELRLGRATLDDLEALVQAFNMAEGFLRMDAAFGRDWATEVQAAQDALRAVVNRGLESNRFVCRAEEWVVMTLAMDIHDVQLDQATVKDLEGAIDVITEDLRTKRARSIKEKTK
jgi:hypothetical protein